MDVEADVSRGMPYFNMVGMLSMEVREAKERIRAAVKNSGYEMRPLRITVNLSPADKRKEGTLFDLPIAIAILKAAGCIDENIPEGTLIIGELGLSGEVKPVSGIFPILLMAERMGFKRCILPAGNINETVLVRGIDIVPVETLCQAAEYFQGKRHRLASQEIHIIPEMKKIPDFSEVHGHHLAKRAAEIAAAGNHNMLMIGPPGSGKSMIAGCIAGIMPELSYDEKVEISTIYSVCGLLKDGNGITGRPFRSPHHAITVQGMTGGGRYPKPGELSLASGGVLFLDELPEFSPAVIDTLRQPLEERKITLVRASGKYEFASDCMLVAAMNPCKCGYYPDRNICRCSEEDIRKYAGRISGAIFDRIDICVEVPRIEYRDVVEKHAEECSTDIRKRVVKAVEIQRNRYKDISVRNNASLSSSQVEKYCVRTPECETLIKNIFNKMNISMRGYYRILKVARTIADLEGSEIIRSEHIEEAVICKTPDISYIGGN